MKTIRDLAIEADSHLSVIVHRYARDLPDDLLAEMRETYTALRAWYQSPESQRSAGGFPITLSAMVAHAKAHGQLGELRRLVEGEGKR